MEGIQFILDLFDNVIPIPFSEMLQTVIYNTNFKKLPQDSSPSYKAFCIRKKEKDG